MKLEKVKAPIEAKFRLACRIISTIAVVIFAIYFIVDCVFMQKATITEGGVLWNEKLRLASKWLSVIFIIAGSALVFTEIIWVIVEIFNFKRDPKWNTYGIVIGSIIVVLGFIAIINASEFIKYDTFIFRPMGGDTWRYTHIDFLVYLSWIFILCCCCLAITWKKIDIFSINLVESDAKSLIRIFSLAPLLIYPFFVWLVMPVDIFVNTNNVIAEMFATIMDMCFGAASVGIFAELIIQFYKNLKLGIKSNKPVITLYLILFLTVFCLFIVNLSFVNDIMEFQHNWIRSLCLYTCQEAASIAVVFLTVFDKKIINRQKHEDIYA